MSIPRTVAEVIREHVCLEVEGIDRMYLNVYVPALQRAGVANNIDLSSKRADSVVAYFRSHGVNPGILSAKGFGDTHPVASNDTLQGRAQNRRIEIVLEGPGA